MSAPKRIQRQRTRGWRMPENTTYVGRPTMWGNPFNQPGVTLDQSLALYSNAARGIWSPSIGNDAGWDDELFSTVYDAMTAWSQRMGDHPTPMIRAALGGRDLACWCPLDRACHGDVLLEIANGGRS